MYNEIKINELKVAIESGVLKGIWDIRGEGSFDNLHIKGAERLSIADVAIGKGLPENKESFVVFY
ncbi:MAG: hypothetical protein L3J82_01050 [Planctomycetes bacterium]|nr:hypothetical protein [Planctomycetota bacterium]